MGNDTAKEKDRIDTHETMNLFNEILGNHIERLLGTRHGIEALPMNIHTVSCLALIAARETEIESFPYLPPDRYTNEKIFDELSEISIEPGEDLDAEIQDMIEKGYIEVADDGRFFAKQPMLSMAQLIDRIFPQMPGLNLIAYLGQMLDEVQMNRKDAQTAVDQFNQMLEIQGVPLEKEGEPAVEKAEPPQKAGLQTRGIKPSGIYSQLQTRTPAFPSSSPKTLTSQLDTRKIRITQPTTEEIPVEEEHPPDHVPVTSEEIKDHISEAPVEAEPTEEALHEETEVSSEEAKQHADISAEAESVHTEEEPDRGPWEEPEELSEDEIVKRVAAFEEKLGMTCPMCRTGAIKAEATAKGKTYYHCSNKSCAFISWGKPYFTTCPECKNPFLVESGRGGTSILKCPRAACLYWQSFPPWEMTGKPEKQPVEPATSDIVRQKPRRKVRRRRVVRRKKKR
ncbi:MAG: hypothetical protein JRC68_09570 [Deltaproteobacteria bacterium]|nr:hypothetical protein [Deltaproteobacteria bacterium]